MKGLPVSVIVPVYNCERYLPFALESILQQNYRPIEIIIVDDGSTDNSGDIAKSFAGIHYIYQANQGPSAARNTGISSAHGEFVAFLDADDTWMSNKLYRQINFLCDHPDMELAFAHARTVVEDGVEKPPWYKKDIFGKDHPCFGASSLVTRKSVFKRVGLYDSSYRYGENAEWLTRAKSAGVRYEVIPETLLVLRVHGRNQTYSLNEMRSNILRALRASVVKSRTHKSG